MTPQDRYIIETFREFRDAQGQALAILTQALCSQLDPTQLKAALANTISAAEQMPGTSKLAIEMATHAMAAAEAERMLQARPPSEGPHPRRSKNQGG